MRRRHKLGALGGAAGAWLLAGCLGGPADRAVRRDFSAPVPDTAALWRTLPGVTNSAGNLIIHLEGNLREYIGRCVAGIPYQRHRDAEFSTTGLTIDDLRPRRCCK